MDALTSCRSRRRGASIGRMAREPQARFLGLPYNWRRPRSDEFGKGVWDTNDDQILTPKNYGWGYGVNFSALLRRVRRR